MSNDSQREGVSGHAGRGLGARAQAARSITREMDALGEHADNSKAWENGIDPDRENDRGYGVE
jgi:hypothetical protein